MRLEALLITHAEPELLSLKDCLLAVQCALAHELLFKLWKSHSKLGHSNSQNPWRRLCELYATLLVVMVQHWIFLTGLWHIPERSLVKGEQMIKEQAARLAACINNIEALTQLLREFRERFQIGWRQLAEGRYEFS